MLKLRNAAGRFVLPSERGFAVAVLESDMHRSGDDLATLLDRPGAEAWPITLTSFVLVDAEPAQGAQVQGALKFLYWCFMHGDDLTRGTGFAPRARTKIPASASGLAARCGSTSRITRYWLACVNSVEICRWPNAL